MLRAKTKGGVAFASVIERHGEYNPTVEYTKGSHTQVKHVRHIQDGDIDVVRITTVKGESVSLAIAKGASDDSQHKIVIDGKEIGWQGPYHLIHSEIHSK